MTVCIKNGLEYDKNFIIPPYTTFSESTEQNNLSFIFEKIKNKILHLIYKQNIKSESDSTKSIEKFKKKFKTNAAEWITLTIRIKEQLDNIDKKYSSTKLFIFRDMIINHVINIVISFILIGPNTSTGSGIDNCNVPSVLFLNKNYVDYNFGNSITFNYKQIKLNHPKISEMIDIFLTSLPMIIENIVDIYLSINEINIKYQNCQQKIQNISMDPDFSQNNIDNNKKLIIELTNLINLRVTKFESIENRIYELSKILKFSYQKHVDWSNILDKELQFNYKFE